MERKQRGCSPSPLAGEGRGEGSRADLSTATRREPIGGGEPLSLSLPRKWSRKWGGNATHARCVRNPGGPRLRLLFQLEYSSLMSATRLLVLGAVRIFQPIHGYDLRRELMSWHADEWANISFGSIYFALKKMTADGLLEEVDTGRSGGRPEKTRYRLTAAGETEFQSLLRE
jgi:hypothetical protein